MDQERSLDWSRIDVTPIRAVIFDFDGTLTAPGALDFSLVREQLRIREGESVLDHLARLSGLEKRDAEQVLDDFEREGARSSLPNEGAEAVVRLLRKVQIPFGVITRNSRASVLLSLENFDFLSPDDFELILTREDTETPKPDPSSMLQAASHFDIPIEELLTVGDYLYDVEAGLAAGARVAFLRNPLNRDLKLPGEPHFLIDHLEQIIEIVDKLRPLPVGKLPNRSLKETLQKLSSGDDSLISAPGVGRDTAIVTPHEEDDFLVLKTDPITFAGKSAPYYAVAVNSNDIATSGAEPKWLMTTLLLPEETTVLQAERLILELDSVCKKFGVCLCGGHTEITEAVSIPVIVGQMAATVSRERLIPGRKVQKGDRLVMTKRVAVEGTALLAREFAGELRRREVEEETIERAAQFLFDPGISVLPEARIAREFDGVVAMHDVTEGGVATALAELSESQGRQFRVHRERILLYPETEEISRAVGIDPLGLIGSGSLLIVCRAGETERLLESLRSESIEATEIGRVEEEGNGLLDSEAWPEFEHDEIARAIRLLKRS